MWTSKGRSGDDQADEMTLEPQDGISWALGNVWTTRELFPVFAGVDTEPPPQNRSVTWVVVAIFVGSLLVLGFFWLLSLALMFYE